VLVELIPFGVFLVANLFRCRGCGHGEIRSVYMDGHGSGVALHRAGVVYCKFSNAVESGGLLLFPPETLARLSYTTTLVHNLSIGPLSTDLSGKSFPLTTIVPFKVMHAQVEVPWCRCSLLAD